MPINQTILVVGGAGYIGSHMTLALQEAGYTVVVLDNLSKGHKEAVLNAELIVGEMGDKALLANLFSTRQIAAVMHFASFMEVGESIKFPAKYYQNNVAATLNLLDAMLQHQVMHFIFSSTAAVYGEPNGFPILEDHPLAPINPYGKSKRMVEDIIQDYAKSSGLIFAILRYFNAAGADPQGRLRESHEPESHLIPLLLQVAKGLRPSITINGWDYPTADGTCVRDYIHVSDLCEAHLRALKILLSEKKSLICNLGTGKGYSVQDVVQAARDITQHAIPALKGDRREGDPAVLVADATRAMVALNWQPQHTDIKTIIQHAWQAFE